MAKSNKKFFGWLITIVILVVLFIATGPFYIVNEGNQVVITRFGSIVNTHTDAGLYIKIPFLDKVTTYPKLVLSLDGDEQRIPTKENQFIIVDTTSRINITNSKRNPPCKRMRFRVYGYKGFHILCVNKTIFLYIIHRYILLRILP